MALDKELSCEYFSYFSKKKKPVVDTHWNLLLSYSGEIRNDQGPVVQN